jgi:MFS family permease
MFGSYRTKRILRRLLQVDRPVPDRPAAEVEAERDRNFRWNFTVNLMDVALFWFGTSFVSGSTIVPLFISKLTDSTLAIGLAALISQGAWYLPQLFTANVVERLPRKKPVVVHLGFFLERLPLWLIVVTPLLALQSPLLALLVFLLAYAWFGFGGGILATSWQDLIARCFPANRRGRFLGLGFFVGAGIGAIAATFSAWLLETFAFPINFFYVFLIAALAILLSWGFLALTREPVTPPPPVPAEKSDFWASLRLILRQDDNFRHFFLARLLIGMSFMGMGFVTVAAIRRWEIADSTVGLFTIALLAGETVGNLFFGLLADRRGHKLSLEIGSLALALAFAVAWLAPQPGWYFAVFALLGIAIGSITTSGILIVLEFGRPEKRPTYTGLVNTSVGVVSIVTPLLAAGLAALNYSYLFALCVIVSLAALILMRWWVQEPRTARQKELAAESS